MFDKRTPTRHQGMNGKQLAKISMNTTNTKTPLKYGPRSKADPFGGYAETTQMKKLMEWEPKIQLKTASKHTTTGLAKTKTSYPNG